MKKTIYSLVALTGLALVGTAAQAFPVKLVKYYQQGTSVARWDGCSDYTQFSNCIKPGTTLANLGVTPSTATWDWDPATGILSSVGDFNSASTISSQAASQVVIGDSVTDLVINTTTGVTTASAYHCIEGTFLSSVGANGCLNTSTGDDFVDDSSAVYNVGGDATCIKVTIGGDDSAMEGAPRGVTTRAASVNCDATDGAFGPWSVAEDLTASGGQLKISNGPLNDANTGVLIFDALPRAVDDTTDAIPTVAKQIDVLANDIALADPVTVAINTAPTKGTATVVGSPGNAADVHISYTGNSGATGTDTFTYDVTTGSTTSTGTVTVTLLDVGANNDTGATTRNKPVTINVGANDTGFTADVTVTQVSCDHGGSFTAGAAGPVASASVTYTPVSAAGSAGYTEVCTYQITDGSLTDTADITVTVTNTVPVANAASISISTVGADPASKTGTLNVASVASNVVGNLPATVTATVPAKGAVSVSGTTLTYTPAASFYAGSDTFDYTITDADGETATATVTVNIPEATPALATISITTAAGTASLARTLNITAGNGPLAQHTLAVQTNGTGGSCTLSGTSVTYTPNAGFSGSDSCVISVTDKASHSATGTVNVTVTAAAGGGGGGASNVLPGGNGALDIWSLALLGSAGAWIRRKRKAA